MADEIKKADTNRTPSASHAPGAHPHAPTAIQDHPHHPHKKEESALSDTFRNLIKPIQDGLSRNMVIALGVIALAIVLFFVWSYFAREAAYRNAKAWFGWERATDLEASELASFAKEDTGRASEPVLARDRRTRAQLSELERLASTNKGTMQARLARFQIARVYLAQGLRDLVSKQLTSSGTGELETIRDVAVKKVQKAAKLYQDLAKESADVPLLAQEALLNGGKAAEALGEYQQAKDSYNLLIKSYPKSLFAKEDAANGLKRLDDSKFKTVFEELTKPDKKPTAP